jgi:hypothetical protein
LYLEVLLLLFKKGIAPADSGEFPGFSKGEARAFSFNIGLSSEACSSSFSGYMILNKIFLK